MYSRKSIRNWVYSKGNDIITDLKRLVNIRSVSNIEDKMKPYGEGCRRVLEEMIEVSANKGFETKNYDYHLGAAFFNKDRDDYPTVGLWGHLDVVPEGEDWDFPPYELTQKGDFLIGRGVQDNKGPVIGLLYALKCLEELKIPIKYNLKLFFGCNEEIGMEDVKYFVKNYKIPDLSIVADSGFPVCYGEKGILHLKLTRKEISSSIINFKAGDSLNTIAQKALITIDKASIGKDRIKPFTKDGNIKVINEEDKVTFIAKGKASHVCVVENSENAIGVLMDYLIKNNILSTELPLLQSILKFTIDPYGIAAKLNSSNATPDKLTGGITMIEESGNGLNMYIDYRYPILDHSGKQMDGDFLVKKIENICSQANIKVEVLKHSRPVHINKDNKIIKKLTNIYQNTSGFKNGPFTMGGGTYARILPNSFAYGMALPNKKIYRVKNGHGDYHQPDESIHMNDLLDAIVIYVESLKALNTLDLSNINLLNGLGVLTPRILKE